MPANASHCPSRCFPPYPGPESCPCPICRNRADTSESGRGNAPPANTKLYNQLSNKYRQGGASAPTPEATPPACRGQGPQSQGPHAPHQPAPLFHVKFLSTYTIVPGPVSIFSSLLRPAIHGRRPTDQEAKDLLCVGNVERLFHQCAPGDFPEFPFLVRKKNSKLQSVFVDKFKCRYVPFPCWCALSAWR